MNERIKELLTQSGLQPYYDAQQGQIEKFAELIVRECASVCEKDKKGFPNSDSVKQGLADMIKEHFGVEE